jgi:hypothetical protein
LPLPQAAQLPDGAVRFLEGGDRFAGSLGEAVGSVGRNAAPALPFEQRQPRLALEGSDALGDGRLRESDDRCRGIEAAVVDHRDQCSQSLEIHPKSISMLNGLWLIHLLDSDFAGCHTSCMAADRPSEATIEPLTVAERRARHWEDLHRRLAPESVSWFQPHPAVSLDLISDLGVSPEAPVIDVGGGTSSLVDSLLGLGFSDVSVLDVSSAALEVARRRVGPNPAVHWLPHDLLSWRPPRRYRLWHDRAVFHFLVDPQDRQRYLRLLSHAVIPGGHIVVGTFARDGPARCSGLPVARYGAEELASIFGEMVDILASRREQHTTPTGVVQPFTWVAGRIRGGKSSADDLT